MKKKDFSSYPVAEVIADVRNALALHKRAVLSAPTGSGKSTVLPLALLDEDFLDGRKIILLEPRRIAAYAVANQLARNWGCALGDEIGYRMRLDRMVSENTRLEVLTEGMLTRKLQRDPELSDTALVIFDEFHERSLQADLALALTLDCAESLRDDLRILLMSATLDCKKASALLGNAPQINSNGRSYPVDIRYIPRRTELTLSENTAQTIRDLYYNEDGSMLVFLPGESDIRHCAGILEKSLNDPLCPVIPLYGRLDNTLQRRAIEAAPAGTRKIVLATSIAESSLTIDGVRIVVDCGLTKIARYQVGNNLERLETVPISRDAAEQRAGRAGRTAPGIACRLWSEFEDSRREASRLSQMSYSDLSGMFLELAAWGVQDIKRLRFMEAPPDGAWQAAREYLLRIKAIDENNRLTLHGKLIHESGLSVRSGHLAATAIECSEGHCGIRLAALLDGMDLRRTCNEDISLLLNDLEHDKRLSQIRRLVHDVEKRLRKYLSEKDLHAVSPGWLLALAFPERVGRRRGDLGELRYLLSGGRAAVWPEMVNLARSEFIVALGLDDRTDNAFLLLAAGVEAWEVAEALQNQFSRQINLKIDTDNLEVEITEQSRLGAIIWSSRRADAPDRTLLCSELSKVIRKHGLGIFELPAAVERLFRQIEFIHKYDKNCQLPFISEEFILENIEQILYDFLPEKVSKNMLRQLDWVQAVFSLMDYQQQRLLKQMLPEKITLENGREFKIDYSTDPPCIAGKLQWFFGVRKQPSLFNGRLLLPIVLQSPAGRPVQTTSDIGNFWQGSYKLVRNDLKGRYPKHDWPENP